MTPKTWTWPDGRTTSNFHLLTEEERAGSGYDPALHGVNDALEAAVNAPAERPRFYAYAPLTVLLSVLALVVAVLALVLH